MIAIVSALCADDVSVS